MTDEAEFTRYFADQVVPLHRLAYALCGDWHHAEDLVQTTFVKLYAHWERVREPTRDAYTRRILVNSFLNGRRTWRREQVVADVPDGGVPAVDRADVVDLGRALLGLSPRQRAMVLLRYLEDMSVTDVADLLGVAEGTVKSQTARGVASLRAALGAPAVTKES